MAYIKWTLWGLFWLFIAAFFHYTLPQHDIGRITDTYEKRIDFGENSIFWSSPDVGNDTTTANRDVFFIQTRLKNDEIMVYRNEDTGWGWPPYFKFDTSNLQAEAADMKSVAADPVWVKITHYGWRNEFLSIFPNAVGVEIVADPDATIIPWFNIIVLVIFFAIVWAIRVRWIRFRENRIDPLVDDVDEAWDSNTDRVRGWFGKRK